MAELKCPHCGEVFQVDESGYSNIAQQVRDSEFKKELERREEELQNKLHDQMQLLKIQQEQSLSQSLHQKEMEMLEKDRMIEQLKSQVSNTEIEKKLAVSEALDAKNKELNSRDLEISTLKNTINSHEFEMTIQERSLKEKYEEQLRMKDEQIAYYKDFKAKQSTKMIGESLEQHCLNQFNAIRMTAFPTAYFEKDNEVSGSGSKGDFIFRENKDGVEFISIMFEMKNEADTTATKHKNEHFLKELDKDRKEKGCEYAVLVSMLESDNDYYNNGIVDVSYKYPKMYVIRPQFFIPMITLLRNAALNSLQYQTELQIVKNQQIDLLHFEENMQTFKEGFSRNYRLASERFQDAIKEIDKTIASLQKTKDYLLNSENNLRLANNKAEELSIKKLTKNAPSVRQMFDELEKERETE